ncbi:hypothetical protein GCM10027187_22550 [Streptosporangium sandarakinum]
MRSFQAEASDDRAEFVEEAIHRQQRGVVDPIRTPHPELVVPDDFAFQGERFEAASERLARRAVRAMTPPGRRTGRSPSPAPDGCSPRLAEDEPRARRMAGWT